MRKELSQRGHNGEMRMCCRYRTHRCHEWLWVSSRDTTLLHRQHVHHSNEIAGTGCDTTGGNMISDKYLIRRSPHRFEISVSHLATCKSEPLMTKCVRWRTGRLPPNALLWTPDESMSFYFPLLFPMMVSRRHQIINHSLRDTRKTHTCVPY